MELGGVLGMLVVKLGPHQYIVLYTQCMRCAVEVRSQVGSSLVQLCTTECMRRCAGEVRSQVGSSLVQLAREVGSQVGSSLVQLCTTECMRRCAGEVRSQVGSSLVQLCTTQCIQSIAMCEIKVMCWMGATECSVLLATGYQ